MPQLVLIRHGQSQWNLENRFTGWVDQDLSANGEVEAAAAGELLRQEGFTFDMAFTSRLKRAIRTCGSSSIGWTCAGFRPRRHGN